MEKEIVFSGHQPNFLPYMGFFYKMFKSDVFVIDDDIQYTRKGLTNSNYIRIGTKPYKIKVPVSYSFGDPINRLRINYDTNWVRKMLNTLRHEYKGARHFDEGYGLMEKYLQSGYDYLVDLNYQLISEIANRFGIGCRRVMASRELPTELRKNERNIWQCLELGGTVYYSGVGGKEYNDEEAYRKAGIRLEYTDYEPVRYEQLGGGCIPDLSVLDYIMNEGFVLPEEWSR